MTNLVPLRNVDSFSFVPSGKKKEKKQFLGHYFATRVYIQGRLHPWGEAGAAPVRNFTIKQFGLSLCLRLYVVVVLPGIFFTVLFLFI